jgi:hypothetical protein
MRGLIPQPLYWGYEDYECLHTRARETLEVVLARRLHLDWRRPNGAKLRADAKTGGSLAEFTFGYSFGAPQKHSEGTGDKSHIDLNDSICKYS